MPGRGGGFCVQSRLSHVTRPSGRETMGMESQGTTALCVCVGGGPTCPGLCAYLREVRFHLTGGGKPQGTLNWEETIVELNLSVPALGWVAGTG